MSTGIADFNLTILIYSSSPPSSLIAVIKLSGSRFRSTIALRRAGPFGPDLVVRWYSDQSSRSSSHFNSLSTLLNSSFSSGETCPVEGFTIDAMSTCPSQGITVLTLRRVSNNLLLFGFSE